MSKYLFKFTPAEPYFFGSEKTFDHPDIDTDGSVKSAKIQQSLYFVRSEDTPSQTTVLGALRLALLLDNGRSAVNFSPLSEREKALVGPASFKPDMPAGAGFGCIRSVSPVFITSADGRRLIPVPFDNKAASGVYEPFKEYGSMTTMDDKKLYAADFDPKADRAGGFMDAETGRLEMDVILSGEQIGINRAKDSDAFFKRKMKTLDSKKGYSFAVICELDCKADREGRLRNAADMPAGVEEYDWLNCPPLLRTAYLGQGRSAFSMEITKLADDDDVACAVGKLLASAHKNTKIDEPHCLVYCLGDAFVAPVQPANGGVQPGKYDKVLFAAVDTREYRAMETTVNASNRLQLKKDRSKMYRLLKAGSILIFKDKASAKEWQERYSFAPAEAIGFNQFVTVELN